MNYPGQQRYQLPLCLVLQGFSFHKHPLSLCPIRSRPAAGAKGFPFIHSCRPAGWRFLSPHPPLSDSIPNLFPCLAAVPLFLLKEPNHNHRSAYNGKQIYEYRFEEISPILAQRLPPYWGKKSSHVNPASKKIFLLQYCPRASILQCLPWPLILQFFPPTIILFHTYPSIIISNRSFILWKSSHITSGHDADNSRPESPFPSLLRAGPRSLPPEHTRSPSRSRLSRDGSRGSIEPSATMRLSRRCPTGLISTLWQTCPGRPNHILLSLFPCCQQCPHIPLPGVDAGGHCASSWSTWPENWIPEPYPTFQTCGSAPWPEL